MEAFRHPKCQINDQEGIDKKSSLWCLAGSSENKKVSSLDKQKYYKGKFQIAVIV